MSRRSAMFFCVFAVCGCSNPYKQNSNADWLHAEATKAQNTMLECFFVRSVFLSKYEGSAEDIASAVSSECASYTQKSEDAFYRYMLDVSGGRSSIAMDSVISRRNDIQKGNHDFAVSTVLEQRRIDKNNFN